jgi:hypothetical protein
MSGVNLSVHCHHRINDTYTCTYIHNHIDVDWNLIITNMYTNRRCVKFPNHVKVVPLSQHSLLLCTFRGTSDHSKGHWSDVIDHA